MPSVNYATTSNSIQTNVDSSANSHVSETTINISNIRASLERIIIPQEAMLKRLKELQTSISRTSASLTSEASSILNYGEDVLKSLRELQSSISHTSSSSTSAASSSLAERHTTSTTTTSSGMLSTTSASVVSSDSESQEPGSLNSSTSPNTSSTGPVNDTESNDQCNFM